MQKKIIGISPRFHQGETQEFIRVSRNYIKELQRDDLIPFIIVETPNLEQALTMCDAFLIIGGDDIDPVKYGQSNEHGLSKGINQLCDDIDYAIIMHAKTYRKPVLGICRGIQAMAAFLGCTLSQDIEYDHLNHPLLEEHLHYVTKSKASNFGLNKYLPERFLINSYHHQAIVKVSNEWEALLYNGDIIEAMEHKTLPLLGVQWHPERFNANESKIIFDYFFNMIK